MVFIIKPLVTEKQSKITEKNASRYGFIVRPEANKLQIKKEVEALYNVTVVEVNTLRYAGKRSSRAQPLEQCSSDCVRFSHR